MIGIDKNLIDWYNRSFIACGILRRGEFCTIMFSKPFFMSILITNYFAHLLAYGSFFFLYPMCYIVVKNKYQAIKVM